MASLPIQCEMCLEENAVGSCDTCGHVGEACLRIHQKGRSFRTHIINVLNKENHAAIRNDITEERCKQHPTERAIFLCKTHESMICGSCLHSEHPSCVQEVVDLLDEDIKIDCDKVNTMKSLFNELKDDILLLKVSAEHSKENYKNNADKCVQECMELGNSIKQRVDELTSNIRDGIAMRHSKNVSAHSLITKMCDEKSKWCANEETNIDDFVDNNMAGYLYLMGRHFEKDISKARSHLKEIKSKYIFKGIDFKQNKVILNCLFEDLEEVCELHEEVTGSDDGNSDDYATSTTEINKTRKQFEQELLKAKQDIEKSEKTQTELRDELKRVKQDLYHSEQSHHPAPGNPIKGDTFTGRLEYDSEGELLCRMVKAAFRRGLMFTIDQEGKVVLDGISLYDGYVHSGFFDRSHPDYVKYVHTLKPELAAKGITEADVKQDWKMEETFTVDDR
ncbi:uncharacterized protein LOC128241177 [Mya arenaria]|uniref:uncharacterized protein LOC128241177 n=1 Tax=Mya arenaria TaxID=6604 RepID=UPI0022DEA136|nr:uncharacterized protein LOC128241177 [Mya arenaria]